MSLASNYTMRKASSLEVYLHVSFLLTNLTGGNKSWGIILVRLITDSLSCYPYISFHVTYITDVFLKSYISTFKAITCMIYAKEMYEISIVICSVWGTEYQCVFIC